MCCAGGVQDQLVMAAVLWMQVTVDARTENFSSEECRREGDDTELYGGTNEFTIFPTSPISGFNHDDAGPAAAPSS